MSLPHTIRLAQRVTCAALLALAATLTPRALAAQTNAPIIVFNPASKTVTEQSLFVRITLCGDQYGVDVNTLQISVNGSSVLGSFAPSSTPVWPNGYEQCVSKYQYEGAISTAAQTTTLSASVTNNSGYPTGSESATYTRPAPNRGVAVVAAAQYVDVAPGATSSRSFTITNTGAAADSFTVTAACTAHTSCTLSSGSTRQIAPGGATTVTVTYGAGSTVGTIGTAKVVARSRVQSSVADSAWSELTVAATPPQGAVLANTPDYLDGSQCVQVGVPGAAIRCGKLVMDHPLPAMRTMNRTWAPGLVYNAGTSLPRPLVAANVTVSGSVPDSIMATLVVNGSSVATGRWPGSPWGSNGTRRIALGFSTNWGTGAYPYTMEVSRWNGGSKTIIATLTGRIVVVNRATSPFGAGWWLGGVEQLQTLTDGSGALLWIGGDGSYRIYSAAGTGVWVAPNVSAPDTIKLVGGEHRRLIPGGGWIAFTNWRQAAAVDRNGRTTGFDYDASGRLSGIRPPLPTGNPAPGVVRYQIGYASGSITFTAVSGISGPALQRTTTAYLGSGTNPSLVSIADPDGRSISFTLDPAAPSAITHRSDKRGVRSYFAQNDDRSVSYVTTSNAQGTQVYYAQYADGMSRGRVVGWGVGASQPLDSAFTLFDGPRTDVQDQTTFWLSRYGAPARIRGASGAETKITYDATWGGIPREVRNASGSVTTAAVRHDGLVGSSSTASFRDDGIAATATYTWNTAARRPTQVQQPAGDYATMYYDGSGNLLWERPGNDAARQVSYAYTNGQVRTVTLPLSGVARYGYDALGNLKADTTPAGWVTTYYADAFGRDTLVVSPIDQTRSSQQKTWFDTMGRGWRTATYGPAMNGRPADSLVVWHEYDEEGNVRFTRRGFLAQGVWQHLQHSWTYDALGRVTQEVRDDGTTTNYTRDPAGNATQTWGDRGHVITTAYDALNRPYRRTTPTVTYGQSQCLLPSGMQCFYTFPTRGSQVVIPADTAVFRYDAGGRLVQADNGYARVRRAYTKSGLLTHDTLRIRKVIASTESVSQSLQFPSDWGSTGGGGGGGGDDCIGRSCPPPNDQRVRERPTPGGGNPNAGGSTMTVTVSEASSPGIESDFSHLFVIRYHYDLNGRRDSLYYPSNAPCLGSCLRRQGYGYSSLTGALETVVDLAGYTHSLAYDYRGRSTQRTSPGWQVGFAYNQDDHVTTYTSTPGAVTIVRDALGRMASTSGAVWASSTYDGMGHLVAVNGVSPGTVSETYQYDALGTRTMLQRQAEVPSPGDNGIRWHSTQATGRVTRVYSDPAQQSYYWLEQNYDFDQAGNAASESSREYVSSSGSNKYWSTRSYYGADEKLQVFNRYAGIGPNSDGSDRAHLGVYEVYWYDALGRRVQMWSRRDLGCNSFWPECASAVNRFVWDGDQVLMERRVTGNDTTSSWLDGGSPNTVAYTHMGGIDAPIAVVKDGVMVIPHANWRGEFDDGHAVIGTLPVINWPAKYQALDGSPSKPPAYVWFGDMLTGFTDGSGQQYRRNRYYNPVSGTFTQKDPIGLAGGMNLYGYAAGDPVNYSDPFGLCPFTGTDESCYQLLANWGARTGRGWALNVGAGLQAVAEALEPVMSGGADCGEFSCGVPFPVGPKPGSAGGPGAGKGFSRGTQNAARAESGNRCVFCGRETVRSPKPVSNRSNVDHAVPKSRGGNNTSQNAQNTCQECNLKKGTQTTEEFVRRQTP